MAKAASAVALACVAVIFGAGFAGAEAVTRDSYREAVEPICKTDTKANERILSGVRQEVKHDKLKAAARRFERAEKALRNTLAELKRVPGPPADAARISRWLGLIGNEADLFGKTAHYLAVGRKGAALGMVVRLESVARRANNVVVPFEFEYCHLDPSRFT